MQADDIIFLGDVHGNMNRCVEVANAHPDKTIIQIGDLGIGFIPSEFWICNLPDNFRFFVGNHDSRQESYKIPNCLGDYGEYKGIFFVSGASSHDRNSRMIGINWWDDEELSYDECYNCLDAWDKSKCDIIATHDCPQSFAEKFFNIKDKSKTRIMLDRIIEIRKPKHWIFGHHHKDFDFKHDDIMFHALGIDKILTKLS